MVSAISTKEQVTNRASQPRTRVNRRALRCAAAAAGGREDEAAESEEAGHRSLGHNGSASSARACGRGSTMCVPLLLWLLLLASS